MKVLYDRSVRKFESGKAMGLSQNSESIRNTVLVTGFVKDSYLLVLLSRPECLQLQLLLLLELRPLALEAELQRGLLVLMPRRQHRQLVEMRPRAAAISASVARPRLLVRVLVRIVTAVRRLPAISRAIPPTITGRC
jgi:hypothetical protein